MDIKKIITASVIFMILLAIATAVIIQIKPDMHKAFMLEKIIYKKVK